MSKRLQVLLPEGEMEELRRIAQLEKVTVGEWVRRTLRAERSRQPLAAPEVKLKAVRKAVGYSFPAADIEDMLAEIERGYLR